MPAASCPVTVATTSRLVAGIVSFIMSMIYRTLLIVAGASKSFVAVVLRITGVLMRTDAGIPVNVRASQSDGNSAPSTVTDAVSVFEMGTVLGGSTGAANTPKLNANTNTDASTATHTLPVFLFTTRTSLKVF